MCNVLLSGELKFLQDRYSFFQTPLRYWPVPSRYPLRYTGRYFATFLNNGPCLNMMDTVTKTSSDKHDLEDDFITSM